MKMRLLILIGAAVFAPQALACPVLYPSAPDHSPNGAAVLRVEFQQMNVNQAPPGALTIARARVLDVAFGAFRGAYVNVVLIEPACAELAPGAEGYVVGRVHRPPGERRVLVPLELGAGPRAEPLEPWRWPPKS